MVKDFWQLTDLKNGFGNFTALLQFEEGTVTPSDIEAKLKKENKFLNELRDVEHTAKGSVTEQSWWEDFEDQSGISRVNVKAYQTIGGFPVAIPVSTYFNTPLQPMLVNNGSVKPRIVAVDITEERLPIGGNLTPDQLRARVERRAQLEGDGFLIGESISNPLVGQNSHNGYVFEMKDFDQTSATFHGRKVDQGRQLTVSYEATVDYPSFSLSRLMVNYMLRDGDHFSAGAQLEMVDDDGQDIGGQPKLKTTATFRRKFEGFEDCPEAQLQFEDGMYDPLVFQGEPKEVVRLAEGAEQGSIQEALYQRRDSAGSVLFTGQAGPLMMSSMTGEDQTIDYLTTMKNLKTALNNLGTDSLRNFAFVKFK